VTFEKNCCELWAVEKQLWKNSCGKSWLWAKVVVAFEPFG